MIWLICELNGVGYRFTSCESYSDAEYLNFELWSYRSQFGVSNSDEFETFLLISSYSRYKIRNGKISSFGHTNGKFTTGIFFRNYSDSFSNILVNKLFMQEQILLDEYVDKFEKKNILFKNEQLQISSGLCEETKYLLYTYIKDLENPSVYINAKNN